MGPRGLQRLRSDLLPVTELLGERFALRRVLLDTTKAPDEKDYSVLMQFLTRTTVWREPFWTFLAGEQKLRLCQNIKLIRVEGERSQDFIITTQGRPTVYVMLRESATLQSLDGKNEQVTFEPLESFGHARLPAELAEQAQAAVDRLKGSAGRQLFRGNAGFEARKAAMAAMSKARIKLPQGTEYLEISFDTLSAEMEGVALRKRRAMLLTRLGLELPKGMQIGGYEGSEEVARPIKKTRDSRQMLETAYQAGSVLVREGAPPSILAMVIEGECAMVRGEHGLVGETGRGGNRHSILPGAKQRIEVMLSTGFHTQLGMSNLGVQAAGSTVGDMTTLLGGVEPATVVAKTKVKVLQCRSEAFVDSLEGGVNARLRERYMAAASAKRKRIEDRAREVDELLGVARVGDGAILVSLDASDQEAKDQVEEQQGSGEPLPQGEAREPDSASKKQGHDRARGVQALTLPVPVPVGLCMEGRDLDVGEQVRVLKSACSQPSLPLLHRGTGKGSGVGFTRSLGAHLCLIPSTAPGSNR
ncbi:unnamed protein product [Chrysoparadoxa australica]